MIYISSSCVKADTIKESVLHLIREGFRNIELSGGTKYYDSLVDDLLELKKKFGLNYLVHNYFPPPKQDFVLNLASLDETIYSKTLKHLETSLELTRLLGGTRFSFHAGFYVDPPVGELGKVFKHSELYNREQAVNQFCKGFEFLRHKFDDVELYIENNCYSSSNCFVYNNSIPFMLLNLQDYQNLQSKIDFKLLLDIAHLLVSSKTLSCDFEEELNLLFKKTDYIHISNNDALHDQNLGLTKESNLVHKMKNLAWDTKIVTLEVYESIEVLKETYKIISSFKKQK
jgi:sugar phosphate isomerase/epimerase